MTPIQRDTHRQTHTYQRQVQGNVAPLTGLPHPSQIGQPSPGSSTWKHSVFKELPLQPAHVSRDIYLPTVFEMLMAHPQTLLFCLLFLVIAEGWGRQAAIPGCHLHRE